MSVNNSVNLSVVGRAFGSAIGHFPLNSITKAIFANSAFLANGKASFSGTAYFNQIPKWSA